MSTVITCGRLEGLDLLVRAEVRPEERVDPQTADNMFIKQLPMVKIFPHTKLSIERGMLAFIIC